MPRNFQGMFKTNVSEQEGWISVELMDQENGTRAVILPGAGAILNAFYVTGSQGPINVIDGYEDQKDFEKRVTQGFRSAKLSPFVCRLHESQYSWNGKDHKLDNKFVWNGSALHGILYDAKFDVLNSTADDNSCSVTLRYQYDGGLSGYPYPYNCTIKYCLLGGGKLTIHTHLSNPVSATDAIPICDGWHPYFKLGGRVNDWWLQMASDKMLEYDATLIPTGKLIDNSSFYPGREIGDQPLDNGFLLKEQMSPLCVLKNGSIQVEFLSVRNYPYLQLYIPEDRETIAIENLSAAPDAFNNGIGLTVLQPGEKADFETTIRIATL